tara:strand:+ start:42 stop:377 length:336 start_codon:yes stop_codon:yes gene_type:complete
MTKRIIDGMTAEQIQGGWADVTQDLLEYLEDLCKPIPSWEDDVSKDNPILCWVSDSPLPEADGKPYRPGIPDYVTGLREGGYTAVNGHYWNYARPVSPDAIWQPTKQGDTK